MFVTTHSSSVERLELSQYPSAAGTQTCGASHWKSSWVAACSTGVQAVHVMSPESSSYSPSKLQVTVSAVEPPIIG